MPVRFPFLPSPTNRTLLMAMAASLSAVPVFSQSQAVSGPGMGLVFDTGTRSLRPIHGIPGSAFLGAPVSETLTFATVAPNGKWALGWSNGQAFVYGTGAAQLPENTLTEVTHTAWTADLSAVVLYAAGTNQVQRIRDPLSTPAAEPAYALPVAGRLNFLAAHGGMIVAGIEQAPVDGLYEIGASGARLLAELAQPAAGVFSRDGSSLLAASRADGRFVEYETREFGVQSASPASTGAVSALVLSADSQSIYAVRGGVLAIMERGTWRTTGELALEFEAAGMAGLAAADVFALASGRQPGDPVWIFAGRTQSIYFVPAGLTSTASEDRQ